MSVHCLSFTKSGHFSDQDITVLQAVIFSGTIFLRGNINRVPRTQAGSCTLSIGCLLGISYVPDNSNCGHGVGTNQEEEDL